MSGKKDLNDKNPFNENMEDDEKWMESDDEDEQNSLAMANSLDDDEDNNEKKKKHDEDTHADDIKSNIESILSERVKLSKSQVSTGGDDYLQLLGGEESNSNVSNSRTRLEEKEALMELARAMNSSSNLTMEYENSDDEEANGAQTSNSDLISTGEGGSVRTSKSKKKHRGSFMFPRRNSNTDKGPKGPDDINSNPYLELDVDDAFNDAENGDKKPTTGLTAYEEKMKRLLGPFVWQHSTAFKLGFVFSFVVIFFLTALFILLMRANTQLSQDIEVLQKLQNETNHTKSPVQTPSIHPTRRKNPPLAPTQYVPGKEWILHPSTCQNPVLAQVQICYAVNIQEQKEQREEKQNKVILGASISQSIQFGIEDLIAIGIQTGQDMDMDIGINSSHNITSSNFDFNQGTNQGTVYIFSNQYKSKRKWEIRDVDNIDSFGYAISLSDDGKLLAVSSPTFKHNTGRVQLFKPLINNETNTIMEWVKIKQEFIGKSQGDREGHAIDLAYDQRQNHYILAIGSIGYDCIDSEQPVIGGSGLDCGRVRVMIGIQYDNWRSTGDLFTYHTGDQFGASVSILCHYSPHIVVLAVAGFNNQTIQGRGAHFHLYQKSDTDTTFQNMNITTNTTQLDQLSSIECSSEAGWPSLTISPTNSHNRTSPSMELALTFGPVILDDFKNTTLIWHQVFQHLDPFKEWTSKGNPIKMPLPQNYSTTHISEPYKATTSLQQTNSYILLRETFQTYWWHDEEDNWKPTHNIKRGDILSIDSFPITSIASDESYNFSTSIAMVRVLDGQQDIIIMSGKPTVIPINSF